MEYRLLTKQDYYSCSSLLTNGSNNRIDPPSILLLENYYFNHTASMFKSFGAIENGRIVAIVFSHFSTLDRSWFVRYVVKDHQHSIDAIINLFEFVLSYAELNFYYRWFVLYNGLYTSVERILYSRVKAFSRYISVTEETIEPRERASSKRYWEDFQECTLSEKDSIIRMYVLEDRYRTFRSIHAS